MGSTGSYDGPRRPLAAAFLTFKSEIEILIKEKHPPTISSIGCLRYLLVFRMYCAHHIEKLLESIKTQKIVSLYPNNSPNNFCSTTQFEVILPLLLDPDCGSDVTENCWRSREWQRFPSQASEVPAVELGKRLCPKENQWTQKVTRRDQPKGQWAYGPLPIFFPLQPLQVNPVRSYRGFRKSTQQRLQENANDIK